MGRDPTSTRIAARLKQRGKCVKSAGIAPVLGSPLGYQWHPQGTHLALAALARVRPREVRAVRVGEDVRL